MTDQTQTTPRRIVDEVAEAMWEAESVRAAGWARRIPWALEAPDEQDRWRGRAEAAITAIGRVLANG